MEFTELISGAKSGVAWAISDLWTMYNPIVKRYLMVMNRDTADDICQDTWIAVARNIHTFQGGHNEFLRFIFTIARNRATDYARAGFRRDNLLRRLDLQPQKQFDVDRIEDGDGEVFRYLGTLSPIVGEMIYLRYVVGMSVGEVSDLVGRSPDSVKVAIHRGLCKLRDLYQNVQVP